MNDLPNPTEGVPSDHDLETRFRQHPSHNDEGYLMDQMRTCCRGLAYVIKQNVPPGREQSLALTKLEEVMFWSNAGIARHRGQRLKDLEHERRLQELSLLAKQAQPVLHACVRCGAMSESDALCADCQNDDYAT